MSDRAVADTDRRETRPAGWGKALALAACGLFIAGAILLLVFPSPFTELAAVKAALVVIVLVFGWKVTVLQTDVIYWNEQSVTSERLLRRPQRFAWADLTAIHTDMPRRATILTFGKSGRLTLLWSFDAHNDIKTLAERILNNA